MHYLGAPDHLFALVLLVAIGAAVARRLRCRPARASRRPPA
jgi:hypothetical protein